MTLTELCSHFVKMVPFDRKGKLGLLRNKVAAHYESSMSPAEMRELLNSTDSTQVGEWLHLAISVLCDLLKLEAYMWNAAGPTDATITIMCQEPILSVLRIEDEKIAGFEGFFMHNVSPRTLVLNVVRSVTEASQCLFERDCQYRINGFVPDSREQWARSLDLKGKSGAAILIVRAQPADEAALFPGGALVVEGDEAGEEGLVDGFDGLQRGTGSLPACGR